MSKNNLVVDRENRIITMSRVYDAPRELVYRVWTDPKHVSEWWGSHNTTTVVDKMDVRPGGQWRYVSKDAEGNEFAFFGEYREIVPPERIVYTFSWEGMPGHVIVETIKFEDENGKTRLTDISEYATIEDLDGMLQTGMEDGATETFDRFGELLERMQVKA
jgi:uncharacterized protein YndB with AHSA1/START domain